MRKSTRVHLTLVAAAAFAACGGPAPEHRASNDPTPRPHQRSGGSYVGRTSGGTGTRGSASELANDRIRRNGFGATGIGRSGGS